MEPLLTAVTLTAQKNPVATNDLIVT